MNRSRVVLVMALWLAVGLFAGCQGGQRLGSFMETATPEGRWRPDGTLIRAYDASLTETYNAIRNLVEREGWIITDSSRSVAEAGITAVNAQNEIIDFKIWAPQGGATEIGVEYNDNNRAGSARVLDMVEQLMPGRRLRANTM